MNIDLNSITDPIAHIQQWLNEAEETESRDPNAMSLATVGADMLPDIRTVLLKEIAPEGLYFYTNKDSAKARELAENPQAAICLYWKSLNRQVRVRGNVSAASQEKSDAYFATRHPQSQAGAWASRQSQPMESREAFEKDVKDLLHKYKDESALPRPPHWGGYIIAPLSIEFWQEGEYRLHTRCVFTRKNEDSPWGKAVLYP